MIYLIFYFSTLLLLLSSSSPCPARLIFYWLKEIEASEYISVRSKLYLLFNLWMSIVWFSMHIVYECFVEFLGSLLDCFTLYSIALKEIKSVIVWTFFSRSNLGNILLRFRNYYLRENHATKLNASASVCVI